MNKIIRTGPDIEPAYSWVQGLEIQPGSIGVQPVIVKYNFLFILYMQ